MRADAKFMARAIRLAEHGRGSTAPNPCVGAVLVRGGAIVAQGWHTACGQAHAEVETLRDAAAKGVNPRECTLYVTLEPCLMCFGALTQARVARVVYGAPDPKVGVSQYGEILERANLNHRFVLEGGLLEAECREMLQQFFRRRR